MLSLMNIVWSMVPISILMTIGEIINELSKEWFRLVCLGYEKAIGVTPGSIYEKSINISDIVDVDLDNANEEERSFVVAESADQPSESDQTEQSIEASVEQPAESDLRDRTEESTNVTIKYEHEDDHECEPESDRKNIAINADPHEPITNDDNSAIADDGIRIE